MTIWVDADSCPARVREVICRAAGRTGTEAVFVANRIIPIPKGPRIGSVRTGAEEDAADRYIVDHAEAGDLGITRDIPLAASLLGTGCVVLNPLGMVFDDDSIRERLSIREVMKEMRNAGIAAEGERSFGPKQLKAFADAFDRELNGLLRYASARGRNGEKYRRND